MSSDQPPKIGTPVPPKIGTPVFGIKPDDPVIATDPLVCFRVVRRPPVFADHQPRYGVEVYGGNGWEPAEPWSRVDGSAVQLLAAEVDRLRKGGAACPE